MENFQVLEEELKPSGSGSSPSSSSSTIISVMSTTNTSTSTTSAIIPVMSTIEMADIAVSENPPDFPL